MIKIHFDGATAYFKGDKVPEPVLNKIKTALTYTDKSKVFAARRYPGIKTDFCIYDWRSRSFPTGLLPKILKILKENQVSVDLVREYETIRPVEVELPEYLYDHQVEAIAAALEKRRGVIECPTGSGKTTIVAWLAKHFPDTNILITVPKGTLMRDMVQTLEPVLNEPIGMLGDKKRDVQRVTVGIINSIVKLLNNDDEETQRYLKGIQVCIRDEAHGSACEMHQKVSRALTNVCYSIGVTATAFREDGKALLLEGATGPLIYKLNVREAALQRGLILRPEFYRVPVKDENWVYPGAIPYKNKKGKVIGYDYKTENGKPALDDVYLTAVVNNEARHRLALSILQAFLNNSERFGTALVLVENINHGEQICALAQEEFGIDLPFISGRDSGKRRVELLDKLRSGELPALCASAILNEGENIPNLELAILTNGGAGERILVQQIGRVVRRCEGKTRAMIVDLADEENYYLATRSLKRWQYMTSRYGGDSVKTVKAPQLIKYLSGKIKKL